MPVTAAEEVLDAADASCQGMASELVLVLHGRIPVDSLKVDGDRRLFDLLQAREPEDWNAEFPVEVDALVVLAEPSLGCCVGPPAWS
ncbi:hypothetical protein [Streptomyces sp. NPDC057623]|uniref:hypothetical protein n=1 Tax=Streptomyces sp. NPDC057623 TaxID=3346187 RepID=UPI0036BCB055